MQNQTFALKKQLASRIPYFLRLARFVLFLVIIAAGIYASNAHANPGSGPDPSQFLITPVGLDFGGVQVGSTSSQQTVTITNVGVAPVVMSGAGGAPGGEFGASQDCQGMTLNPGDSCHIFYTFNPTAAGPATAASSGTWNGQPFSISLTGTGVPPEFRVTPTALDFGEIQVGSASAQQTVTITNVGISPIVMSGAGGAPGGEFGASQDCQGMTLNPGNSCHIFYTFNPTAAGPASATSSGTWNGQPFSISLTGMGVPPIFRVTPTALDFGEIQVGSTSAQQTVTITNAGPAPVVMSGAGGAPGGEFGASQDCQGMTLNPGDSCHIFYTFIPTLVGSATATSAGTWNGQPFSISLGGAGIPPGTTPSAQFLITPVGLDFGRVQFGTVSYTQTVNITNIGLTPVVMSGAGGAPGGEFGASQDCQGMTLNPGGSCHIFYTFNPTAVGPSIATSAGTWNGQPFSISLTGTGVPPEFRVTPAALDFGSVQAGSTSAQQTVTITNAGLAPVVMSGAGGAPGGEFGASQDCQGMTLNPGDSCHIFYTFNPTAAGPATATSSGTWNGQPFSIALKGTGVAPAFRVTPTALDFGGVQVGSTSAQQTVTITNAGLAPVVMSGAGGAPGGEFNASQDCQGMTLNPGGSCHIFYTFNPTAVGPATASSTGTWNGQPFSVALKGTGVPPVFQITPTALDFGEVQVGSTSAQQTVTITNIGIVPVVMSGAGGAPGGEFNASQDCQGMTLNPGDSCHIFYSFSPTVQGPASATSIGTWNGQPFSIALSGIGMAAPILQFLISPIALDFGSVPVGTTSAAQAVTVTNVGNTTVLMSGTGGAPGGDFSVTQNCEGTVLMPGESCQMSFTFAPSMPGIATAVSSGTWNGQAYSIALRGTGLGPLQLIGILRDLVNNLPVNNGIRISMLAKIDAAESAIEQGSYKEAKNILSALLHEISAQAGKKLTLGQAQGLAVIIQQIMGTI